MKTIFIPAYSKINVSKVIKKVKIEEKIGLITTIQFLPQLKQAKQLLKNSVIGGQITGCNINNALKIKNKVNSFLYIGSGIFHPIEIAIKTKKKVYIANPITNEVSQITKEQIEKHEKQRKGSYLKLLSAEKVGILISTKPGQYNLKNALKIKNKVKKVIFSSSASVYGNPEKLPVKEDDKTNPVTPYCISKLASEYLLKFFSERGLNYVILRYFNVYGKGQNIDAFYTSVVNNFIKKVLKGESPEIHGKGNQSMDLINVRDVVKADIMSMESKVKNEIFNVGSGKQTTVKELAELILKILDKKSEVKYIDREVIASRRQADISKIRKMLGWEPEVKLEDGIREIVEGYRNERI